MNKFSLKENASNERHVTLVSSNTDFSNIFYVSADVRVIEVLLYCRRGSYISGRPGCYSELRRKDQADVLLLNHVYTLFIIG